MEVLLYKPADGQQAKLRGLAFCALPVDTLLCNFSVINCLV